MARGTAVVRLYGRDEAARIVRRLMTRPPPSGDHPPILVCEGPPASGKTELLRALAGLMEGRVPYAQVDLQLVESGARLGEDAVPELLAALAFQLARRTGRYGALRFPRLVVGHLVMGLTLEWLDRAEARSQVDAALSAHRGVDRWTRTLGEAAAAVLARVPGLRPVPPSLVRRMLTGAVHAANRWGPGRRMLLGPYQEWYGRHRGAGEPAIEALVGLNRWAAHNDNPDNRERIANLLLSAFLADATENFAGGDQRRIVAGGDQRRIVAGGGQRSAVAVAARAEKWSLNAVLLLDNADCELGRTFLNQLVQARRDHAAGGLGDADPLTVVVTSRGDLLSEVDGGQVGRRHWWLRYEMRPLTLDETNVMVSALPLNSGNSQRLAQMIHTLTGGQPAATHMLLDLIADRQTGLVEMDDLLGARRQGRTVEDALCQRLLAGVPPDAMDDLVTCAAARDRVSGRLIAQSGLIRNRGVADAAAVTAGLWGTDQGAEPTLIRRLLLRKLESRPPHDPCGWDNVHQWLHDDTFDRAISLYYAVARQRFDLVADALTEQLDARNLSSWLDDLHSVVWAPRPVAGKRSNDSPAALAQRLAEPYARPDPVYNTVLNLLTSLCVARDPLCGSLRSGLYFQIASRYGEIAHHIGTGSDELALLVQQYQVRARQWQQQLAPPQPAGPAAARKETV